MQVNLSLMLLDVPSRITLAHSKADGACFPPVLYEADSVREALGVCAHCGRQLSNWSKMKPV